MYDWIRDQNKTSQVHLNSDSTFSVLLNKRTSTLSVVTNVRNVNASNNKP